MNIQGLTMLNRVATILFGIIGSLTAFAYYFLLRWNPTCKPLAIIWICLILLFTWLLYYYTVVSLEKGDYYTAKTWTFVGIIIGLAGGIIPFILFLISYIMFDEAIRTQQYGPTPYSNYQQPNLVRYCISCRRQIPLDSNLCPYCGVKQPSFQSQLKTPTQPRSSVKPEPEQKKNIESPPPP